MLRLDAGYYILDARRVMLNAKIQRALADSGFRGAQAALLLSSAACRRNSLCRNRKINRRLTEDFSAGCRKEQAGSLRSPEPAAPARVTALAHKIS
jgi:hypothetical protein